MTAEQPADRDEADVDTVASRAAQVIASMGADIRALTRQRDRYRTAWRSARERAQAYGEGILRVVKDREAYQEWLRQAEEQPVSVVSPSVPADRAAEEVTPPPALTEVGRLRAQVAVLQQDAERDRGLAKVGARCMREGHQGLIEGGRLVLEGWRFALSTALDLDLESPWEAIHERAKELRRLAAEAPQPETQARPAEHEWFVETRMLDGHWSKYGASRETAADGRELFGRDTAGPGGVHAFRLVHAMTSYAIEAEHEPADEAQAAPPVEPHPTEADLRHALTVLARFHGRDTTAPAAGSAEGDQR